jgi:uncharacterized protein (TIGR04222 family)
MLNPITELGGVQFLLFYAVLIGATVLLCRWWLRLIDPTAAMPVPQVPSEPDPYEVACLRGAEDEVAKAVIAGLYQRDYLCSDTDPGQTFRQASNHAAVEMLSPLERSVFEWFVEPRAPGDIKNGLLPNVGVHCVSYAEKLEQEQLLTSDEVENKAQLMRIVGVAVIAGVGALRALVGMTREQPIGFLILMGFFGCVVLWGSCSAPRLSSRGTRYLEEISKSFTWLKQYVVVDTKSAGLEEISKSFAWLKGDTSSGATTIQIDPANFLLLAGVFGLSAAGYSYVEDTIKPKSSGGAGGCGGGDGGGGGGGGCGGCGGCG